MKLNSLAPNRLTENKSYHLFRTYRLDILLIVILVIVAGVASFQAAQLINPAFIWDKQLNDAWFHNDTTRVFDDMAVYEVDHYRTDLHPLFVLLSMPIVYALKATLSIDSVTSVRLVTASIAALWFGLLFVALRIIGCRSFDAILFSIFAGTSAASIFWFVMPETYQLGSATMLMGLLLAAVAQFRQVSSWWYVLVGVLTLGITVTNWMVGIFATIVNHRWKKTGVILLQTYIIVALLVVVQKLLIFPKFNSKFLILFLGAGREAESTGFLREDFGGLLASAKSFIFDTIVLPAINVSESQFPIGSRMSVQLSHPGSASVWGSIAVVLWMALLSLGIWALFSLKVNRKFRIVLGLSLLGQLLLELVYGDERFVHAPHFLPFLVIVAALSTLTKARVLALVLAGMLTLTAGVNNILQFNQAVDYSYGRGVLCATESIKCNVENTTIPANL